MAEINLKRLTFVVLRMERLVLRQWKESASVYGVGEMAGWARHREKDVCCRARR